MKAGFVYFIRRSDGPVKIGFSAHPVKRLSELQTVLAEKLSLLGVMSGTVLDEREIHSALKRYRLNGEWFDFSTEVRAFITSTLKKRGTKKFNTYVKPANLHIRLSVEDKYDFMKAAEASGFDLTTWVRLALRKAVGKDKR